MIVIPVQSDKYGEHNIFIDGEDFDKIKGYNWYISKGRSNTFYAGSKTINKKTNKRTSIWMHRLILNSCNKNVIDHIDHNGLNNCRSNLRVCTQSENCKNKMKHDETKTSKYKGVGFKKSINKFQARICFNYKQIFLGYYENESDAVMAYNEASLKYHGEYGFTNKI